MPLKAQGAFSPKWRRVAHAVALARAPCDALLGLPPGRPLRGWGGPRACPQGRLELAFWALPHLAVRGLRPQARAVRVLGLIHLAFVVSVLWPSSVSFGLRRRTRSSTTAPS